MSDHAHSTHVPTIVSLGSSLVAFAGQFTSESQGTLIVGLGGLVFAVFAHFSDKKRLDAENQQLRIDLASERATSAQKDHRIAFLEAKMVVPPVPAVAPTVAPLSEPGQP